MHASATARADPTGLDRSPTPPHIGQGENQEMLSHFLSERCNAAHSSGPLGLRRFLGFNNRLRGGQTRNRHAERRSAHIVHTDLVAKLDAVRIAAMLAANADFELWTRLTAIFDAPT